MLIVWYKLICCLGKKSINLIVHKQNDGNDVDVNSAVTVVPSDVFSVEDDKLWIESQEVGNQLFYTCY